MEKLSIKTPDDFIALMGHSLGFWPQESLVCVLIDDHRIGGTLRVDLPRPGTNTDHFVDQIAHYVGKDREATGVVFGLFTRSPWTLGQRRPHEEFVETLTERLGEQGVIVRDGWLVGNATFTNYLRADTGAETSHPLDGVLSSELNAELVFRGSSVETTPSFRIPVLPRSDLSAEVLRHSFRIEAMNPRAAIVRARALWSKTLDATGEPTDDESAELIASLKFISVRDRLLADIPGLDDSMRDLLLGETQRPPHWQRVDRASDVLLHLYMRVDNADAAPVLTCLGIIQWWEGHGSKAHQCFQRTLESDPNYRLAQLTDQLVSAGILSTWATSRQTAYQPPHTRGPEIGGMGMA
ncbi:DUF4192 domain-containing protein [Paeniglutamicibacter antarcticus]|uniref:DUF4192 domain-containing protein n=1 Tax=Arthrobacter terrae TaxID=2935737 RepID=A0A931G7J6_9MICC|nr:DUF4192 domain-containing protein [Arthrobacter terrae]MBG0741820.1 DUF4192 domain-containing protein [Arthrobacter terrae]